jgi:hypothetical protein
MPPGSGRFLHAMPVPRGIGIAASGGQAIRFEQNPKKRSKLDTAYIETKAVMPNGASLACPLFGFGVHRQMAARIFSTMHPERAKMVPVKSETTYFLHAI